MSTFAVQAGKRVLLPVAVLLAAMIGLGLLVTRVLAHVWPLTVEDGINRELAGDRAEPYTGISFFFSAMGDTSTIVLVTAFAALALRLILHRWREAIFLCLAVTAQALVFFFVTLAIDRQRPDVQRLDASPPTSSFPSGHTSAATALYLGLALLLAAQVRSTWLKALCWTLALLPIAVALARVYRGMHHPSDVLASFLSAGTCLAIMWRSILDRHGITYVRARREPSAPTR